jgi:hypothetical protein
MSALLCPVRDERRGELVTCECVFRGNRVVPGSCSFAPERAVIEPSFVDPTDDSELGGL